MESWAYSWFRSKPKAAPLPGESAGAKGGKERVPAAKAKVKGGLLFMLGRGSDDSAAGAAEAEAEAEAAAAAAAAASVRSRGRGHVSAERAEFDAAVDDISGSTARLKQMALRMGDAVDESNAQLDRIATNTDHLNDNVNGVKKRTTNLLR